MLINRRRILELSGATGLALAAGGLPAPAFAEDLSTLLEPGPMGDKFIGKEDAPVTIIEYASMTCPHCATFHKDVLPGLKEKFIETGKARLIFREFPFDPRAMAAFMLARCAPEGMYFPMIDVLFKQQSKWVRAQDPVPPLQNIAKLAGFTQESFETCLKNQKVLDSVMAVQKKAAKDYGVNATPMFFINGEKFEDAYTLEAMSKAIEAAM